MTMTLTRATSSAARLPVSGASPALASASEAPPVKMSLASDSAGSAGSVEPVAPWARSLLDTAALRLRGTAELRANRALQRLPLIARTLVRLLRDIDTALAVVAAYGGTTLHIPAERSAVALARHPLRKLLTLEQMRRLVRYFAGTDVYIPRCLHMLLRVRDVQIVRQFDAAIAEGRSGAAVVRMLAREYRLSDRWVWCILGRTVDVPAACRRGAAAMPAGSGHG